MSGAVDAVNRILTGTEPDSRHAVLDEAFTVANGRMTPTLRSSVTLSGRNTPGCSSACTKQVVRSAPNCPC